MARLQRPRRSRPWPSKAGKVMNTHEIALAARFVEALDASSSGELVDPSALSSGSHLRPGAR